MLQRGCVSGDNGVPCDISVRRLRYSGTCADMQFHHVSSSFLTLRLYLGELALGCLGCLDVADAGRPIILPLPQTDPPAEMGGTCQELCSLCIGLPWIATGLPLDAKSCYVLLP